MKKFLYLIITIILLICAMSGCSSKNTEFESYYESGFDLISLSLELAESEEYVKSYNISTDQQKLLDKLTLLDNPEPVKVFSLDLSDEMIKSLSIETNNCSEAVKAYLASNVMKSIPTIINTKTGDHNTVVASSVASASMTFDHTGENLPRMYLYIFENNFSYAVNFNPGYDNSVLAVAVPIFDDALSNCSDINDIVKYLGKYGISAEQSDISVIYGQ